MTFQQKFDRIIDKNNSLLCIGLDPVFEKIPPFLIKKKNPFFEFNQAIIDATADLVCAYKPNIAFYEAYGLAGLLQLKFTINYLQKKFPEIPVILDTKRTDIGNTNKMYAKAIFDFWQADATTVYPYLGLDSVKPFLEYHDKLIIILIRTSNPDAKMFQDAKVGELPYFLYLAKKIKDWNYQNIGIFVGATYHRELKQIRKIFPEKIFLSAGIGAQKGDVANAVTAGLNKDKQGIMFNVSRSIIYASNNQDFAQQARRKAQKLRDEINQYRKIR